MAISLGERLAGAGQIQSAFREEQMRAREARERTQQLRDAQRMRQAREAAARNLPQFGAGAVVPSMAGLRVSGLPPVAGTQAPAQRQPAPTQQAVPVTTASAPASAIPPAAAPAVGTRAMELQYRQGLTTQAPPGVSYTQTQEQQLAGMRQRRAVINSELRYIDEQLRQIPTSGVLGSGDQVLRQTYEAQKARLMTERQALVNQLRDYANLVDRLQVPLEQQEDGSFALQRGIAVPTQIQPGQAVPTTAAPAAAPAAGVRPDMMRFDGTIKSERGFLGPITNNISGKTMTELSVGSPGSPEGYYPLLVPTLTQDEIRTLQNLNIGTDPIPPSILRKAKAHADQRIAQGLSPFYQDGETAAAPTAPPKQQKAQEELTQAAQTTPMGEGPGPGKLADTVAAATSGVMYGRGAEDFDPQAASVATQQALELRQTILAQYNALRQYGFGFRAAELIPQIQAIDLGLYKAQGEQGVYEGITTGNYSKAVTVLSQMQGIPHQVLDRGDGTYDLYVNGRVSETAQTPAALADYFRYQIDQGYRARKAEIASAEYQQQAKINEIVAKSVMDAQGNLQVALLNAEAELAKEQIKGAQPQLTLDTANGVVYVRIGDQVSIVNPRGQVMEIAGEQVEMPTTTRVPGFGG